MVVTLARKSCRIDFNETLRFIAFIELGDEVEVEATT